MICEKCKREEAGADTDTEGLCYRCARHERIKSARNRKLVLESHGFTITSSCYSWSVRLGDLHVCSGGRMYQNPDYDELVNGALGMLEQAVTLAERYWRGKQVRQHYGQFSMPTPKAEGLKI